MVMGHLFLSLDACRLVCSQALQRACARFQAQIEEDPEPLAERERAFTGLSRVSTLLAQQHTNGQAPLYPTRHEEGYFTL